jgi:hypothetical protein
MNPLSKKCCTIFVAAALIASTPTHAEAKKPPTCREYIALATKIGWKRKDLPTLEKIMYRESRCYRLAWNQKDPWGGSHGLMQINGSNVGWATRMGYITKRADLYRPKNNLKVSLELYRLYGWRPWSTRSSSSG